MSETQHETEQLQTWFDAQGMTMTALGDRLGVSLSYVSRLLSGERPITSDVKWRFSEAFGYDATKAIFNGQAEQAQ